MFDKQPTLQETGGKSETISSHQKDFLLYPHVWGNNSGVAIFEPPTKEEDGESGTYYEDVMFQFELRDFEWLINQSGWGHHEVQFKKFAKRFEDDEYNPEVKAFLEKLMALWAKEQGLINNEGDWKLLRSEDAHRKVINHMLKIFKEYNLISKSQEQTWIDTFRKTLAKDMTENEKKKGNPKPEVKPEDFHFYITTHTPLDTRYGTDFFIIYKDIFFPFDLTKNHEKLYGFARIGKGLPIYIKNKRSDDEVQSIANIISDKITTSEVWYKLRQKKAEERRAKRA